MDFVEWLDSPERLSERAKLFADSEAKRKAEIKWAKLKKDKAKAEEDAFNAWIAEDNAKRLNNGK